MGKFRHRSRGVNNAKQHPSMVEHGVRDRSNAAEPGSVHPTSGEHRSGADGDISGGNDANLDSGANNGLSERPSDICDIDADRWRVSGSPAASLKRSFDPTDINPLLRNAAIALKGINSLDATALLADPRNILLVCDGGALLFCWCGEKIYELTEFWKDGFRGEYSADATLKAVCWMYSHTDCAIVMSRVPCVSLIARNPLLIDSGQAILQVIDDRSCKVIKMR